MEPLTQKQLDALFRTPESKQLLILLQEAGDAALRKAADAAKAGDFSTVQQVLQPALCRTETQALIKKLSKTIE